MSTLLKRRNNAQFMRWRYSGVDINAFNALLQIRVTDLVQFNTRNNTATL